MLEFLESVSLFPIVLTLGAYQLGLWLRKKWNNPLCNPLLIAVILVIGVLLATGYSTERYIASTQVISWLLTPATVCLALPLYEQLKALKKNLPAILIGITAGTVTSLAVIFILCKLWGLDRAVTVSLLPKSITTAMDRRLPFRLCRGIVICWGNVVRLLGYLSSIELEGAIPNLLQLRTIQRWATLFRFLQKPLPGDMGTASGKPGAASCLPAGSGKGTDSLAG